MGHAKQFAIPLTGYYVLRETAPDAGYGGAIPLTGYTDIRGLSAKYDRQGETLYIAFSAERSNRPLAEAPVPAELEDEALLPVKPTPRGHIHTAFARTKATGDRALAAVPDVAENIDPVEEAPGALADKNESLAVVILPEETELPGFEYQEPLLVFFRDGKSFYAYVEEQTDTTLSPVLGSLDSSLAPLVPGSTELSRNSSSVVAAYHED